MKTTMMSAGQVGEMRNKGEKYRAGQSGCKKEVHAIAFGASFSSSVNFPSLG